MREIKYRYWYNNTKMIEVGSIQFFTDGTYIVNDELAGGVLLEYTGLKDKNGKEIYEGDILRRFEERVASDGVEPDSSWIDIRKVDNFEYMSGNKGIRYFGHEIKKVYWSDKSCGFEPFSDSEDNCGHCGGSDDPTDWEVIGNIYENPELLRV